jgi:poly(A) polymerase
MILAMTNLFRNANYQLYEVGGHLRDELLGRESHDIDLTTNACPEETLRILQEAGYEHIYTVGIAYGTVCVVVDGQEVEITTYRDEVYPTGSRKPIVTYGNDLTHDLARRDFTINSMARDPRTGEIVDPMGGMVDLMARRIRCVGNSHDRFREDPLRMLRAVRFACQLGFTLDVTIEEPQLLNNISKERIQEELNKILMSPNPTRGIDMLVTFGLMRYIIPEINEMVGMGQGRSHFLDVYEHTLNVLHKGSHRDHGEDNLTFRLACLLHDIGKPATRTYEREDYRFFGHHTVGGPMAEEVLRRLRYPIEIQKRVGILVSEHMTPLVHFDPTPRALRRFIRRVGSENLGMLFDLNVCDVRSTRNDDIGFLEDIYEEIGEALLDQPEAMCSPLSGLEIMEFADIRPGREVGNIKNHLTEMVVEGLLDQDDKETAFAIVRNFVNWERRP